MEPGVCAEAAVAVITVAVLNFSESSTPVILSLSREKCRLLVLFFFFSFSKRHVLIEMNNWEAASSALSNLTTRGRRVFERMHSISRVVLRIQTKAERKQTIQSKTRDQELGSNRTEGQVIAASRLGQTGC